MQRIAGQQRADQQQGNKSPHAIPAVFMPEHAAERPGKARTEIVAKEIQRRRLTSGATRAWANPAAGDRVRGKEPGGEQQHAGEDHPQRREQCEQQTQ